jgi:7-cyano-7-deazaguanine synthase
MLTDPSIEVPDISYDQIKGVSPTYVPFRNGMMLSTLASHIAGRHFDPSQEALKSLEDPEHEYKNPDFNRDVVIYFGAHAEDAQNWAYPDCTPEFIGAMANALYIGTYYKLRLVAPFQHMSKDRIISRGAELNTPYYLTWSCYRGGGLHCGVCATCRARKLAFIAAGVQDPTTYAA